ncbi:hypothetical protein F4553_006373 [Allocatelliglobosispora scoriae]|uniref:Uncharacterized protein n=1 Tax=Allocatelliglobosispora scoriae TaxID=643052 RepID=A0A841C0S1_9ACTN|nr:hypothetical protein [Allocatelliglobosispora scoriae]MBB5872939.1 hypothetical protein [Allocatelliglobosispora scoriae]
MSDNASVAADEPPPTTEVARLNRFAINEDWAATVIGLVLLGLVLAGVITTGLVP